MSPAAIDDLANIYRYIVDVMEGADNVALAFVSDFNEKIIQLATSGSNGVARDWIRPGLHAFPYRDRCIYFRIDGDTMIVLRVLHGHQDIDQQNFNDTR